jgi:hypothetical protein
MYEDINFVGVDKSIRTNVRKKFKKAGLEGKGLYGGALGDEDENDGGEPSGPVDIGTQTDDNETQSNTRPEDTYQYIPYTEPTRRMNESTQTDVRYTNPNSGNDRVRTRLAGVNSALVYKYMPITKVEKLNFKVSTIPNVNCNVYVLSK